MTDLLHWNSVREFEFAQAVRLAVGVDPYNDEPLDAHTRAKECLLRQQMSDAHLRAANWAFSFLKWLSRLSEIPRQCFFFESGAHLPLIAQRYSTTVTHTEGTEFLFRRPARPLLPTVALQASFERVTSPYYKIAGVMRDVVEFGDLKDFDTIDRDVLAEWFLLSEWTPTYDFSRANFKPVQTEDDTFSIGESSEATLPHPRTEKNYLALILAMAVDGYGYDRTGKQSAIPKELSDVIFKRCGYSLSDETIRRYLKVAGSDFPEDPR